MNKNLIVLVIFISCFSGLTSASPTRENSISPELNFIVITSVYGLINFIPSNIEYSRHKDNQTSYSSIYWYGFFGGIVGGVSSAIIFDAKGFSYLSSMLIGIVAGNKFGHYRYVKNNKRMMKITPYLSSNKYILEFELNY